jgi:hypothetical protein
MAYAHIAGGMEGLEALRYKRRFRHPRIQPQIVIFLPQNHGHTIIYISDERCIYGICSKPSPVMKGSRLAELDCSL